MDMMHTSALRRDVSGKGGMRATRRYLRTVASCSVCSLAIIAAVVVMQTAPVRDFCSSISRIVYVEFAAQLDQMESSMGRPRV